MKEIEFDEALFNKVMKDIDEYKNKCSAGRKCPYFKFYRACKRLSRYKKYFIIKRWVEVTEKDIKVKQ